MGQILSLPLKLLGHTSTYYGGFLHYWLGKGRHSPYRASLFDDDDTDEIDDNENDGLFEPLRIQKSDSAETKLFKQHARIHLYSLALNFYLFTKPHYRKACYRDDLWDNLRNIAIPGTGIPLSFVVARNRFVALLFLATVYPTVSFTAAVREWLKSRGKVNLSAEYATRLLAPDDWFSYWRLNCNVVALHSLLSDMPADYDMENKWHFLEQGAARGVPVSPFLQTPALVVKHRNEEGGLGIFFYKNATVGGDWILQERIENSDWVASLLPPNAPLSTFRVITCSRAGLDMNRPASPADIHALSCVFRAGRAGANTDHVSILFDVNVKTGLIQGGTTNAHWYKLGLWQWLPGQCPWTSSHADYQRHPDGDIAVSGNYVPDIGGMLKLVQDSHYKLCPRVPFCGWDVVFSKNEKVPICLLEVNLSCNFFRGSFDRKFYLDFVDEAFSKLQAQRLVADKEGKQFKNKK